MCRVLSVRASKENEGQAKGALDFPSSSRAKAIAGQEVVPCVRDGLFWKVTAASEAILLPSIGNGAI